MSLDSVNGVWTSEEASSSEVSSSRWDNRDAGDDADGGGDTETLAG